MSYKIKNIALTALNQGKLEEFRGRFSDPFNPFNP